MIRQGAASLLLLLIVCVGIWRVYGVPGFSLAIPLGYAGDSLWHLQVAKRLLEGFWYLDNSVQGFPFGARMYDLPGADFGSLMILKLLGVVTGSAVLATNLYFLLSFPVTALVTLHVLRRMEIAPALSLAGAVLFTFAPFHFIRLGHLYYAWYWVVPVFFLYGLKIFSDSPSLFGTGMTTAQRLLRVAVLLLLSSFGVYYAFFGVLILLAAGVAASISRRSMRNLRASLAVCAIVTAGVVANIAPSLVARVSDGPNQDLSIRVPFESEVYGLKITQLLLPQPFHPLPRLSGITKEYAATFPLTNENWSASLGLVASVGFLFLLYRLGIAPFVRPADHRVAALAFLTMVLLLMSTIGGFSSLFAMFVSPLIRAWNRVSIFISFASVTAAMLLLQAILADVALRNKMRLATPVAALAVTLLGVWDQLPVPCLHCFTQAKADFDDDRLFVKRLEQLLPTGAPVYHLPYMAFPEEPPLFDLHAYEHARPYIVSSTLRWSYGGIRGRLGDTFFRNLAKQPMARQMEIVQTLGFAGVYVDRRGYADRGRQLERDIAQIAGMRMVVSSQDGNRAFFALPAPRPAPAPGTSARKIIDSVGFPVDHLGLRYVATLREGIDFRRDSAPFFIADIKGLSITEPFGRWSDAKRHKTVLLRFVDPLPRDFTLLVKASAFGPNVGAAVKVRIGGESGEFRPTAVMQEHRLRFRLQEDARTIEISIPEPLAPSTVGLGADTRRIGLGFERIAIEP